MRQFNIQHKGGPRDRYSNGNIQPDVAAFDVDWVPMWN